MMERLFAPSELQAQRRDICAGCAYKNGAFCSLCGCVIAGKTKLQGASCPIKKW